MTLEILYRIIQDRCEHNEWTSITANVHTEGKEKGGGRAGEEEEWRKEEEEK